MKKLYALVLTAAMAAPAMAQDGADQNLADSWAMTVKPGMAQDFEAAFKAHIGRRAAAGDPREWHVYTTEIGGDFDRYVVRACCFDWASFDAYETWSNENGMGADWNENVDAYVDSYEHVVSQLDFENSHWPEDAGPYKFFGVTSWRYAPGKGPSVGQAIERMSQEAIEGEWDGVWSWSNPMGGKAQLNLVIPYENYADMAPPETTFYQFLVDRIGEDEANAVFADFSGGLTHGSYTVYRHRADLSMGEDG